MSKSINDKLYLGIIIPNTDLDSNLLNYIQQLNSTIKY
jgi:hypothetical protein